MAAETPTEDAQARKERLRRRLVAARTLAGLGQQELAAKIKALGYTRGYSARTIGDMERGETPIQPQAIPVLAKACGLPPEFFEVDFQRLPELLEDEAAASLEDEVAKLREELKQLAKGLAEVRAQRFADGPPSRTAQPGPHSAPGHPEEGQGQN